MIVQGICHPGEPRPILHLFQQFNRDVVQQVASAVQRAAIKTGVARKNVEPVKQ
jgi:malic enzyme